MDLQGNGLLKIQGCILLNKENTRRVKVRRMILTVEAERAFGLYMVQRFKIADWETFEKLDELI